MKNIHLILTSQFSNLAYYQESTSYNKPILQLVNMTSSDYTYQHLYITNDEDPKNGEWVYHPEVSQEYTKVNLSKEGDERYTKGQHIAQGVYKHKPTTNEWYKKERKIILTTDPNLIVDGIQAIDDKFLEWFCNNSSCEEVETYSLGIQNAETGESGHYKYEIIIPKEEFKQECEYCRQAINKYGCACAKPLKDFKQETLEDFIKSYVDKLDRSEDGLVEQCLKDDANWQAKKSYSEEDLIQLLSFVSKEYNISNGIGYFHTHESFEDVSSKEVVQKWFETLKKNNL